MTYPRIDASVRYGTLLKGLAAASGVAEPGLTAFENRLKHLKRNGFPAGVNLGKTGRYNYSPQDVVGIAAALRLIDAYVMPTTAIQLVETSAPQLNLLALDQIVPRIALGEQRVREGRAAMQASASKELEPWVCVVFQGAALSELGSRSSGGGRYEPPVQVAKLVTATDLQQGIPNTLGSGIIIQGEATFDRLFDELVRLGLDAPLFAAGLLATVSPQETAAVRDTVEAANQLGVWHLAMLNKLLADWSPGAALGERERVIAHHARLLLCTLGGAGAAHEIELGSGIDARAAVCAVLEELKFPNGGWPIGEPSLYHQLSTNLEVGPDRPTAVLSSLLERARPGSQ
jgi:hypothetical protein